MTKFYDSDYDNSVNSEEEQQIYDEIQEETYFYEHRDDEEVYVKEDPFLKSLIENPIHPPIEHEILKIGNTTLEVLSNGKIKKAGTLDLPTIGDSYSGTPYMTYNVEIEPGYIKKFFVHDIVWRAFCGKIPADKEVRHMQIDSNRAHKKYSNALCMLSLCTKTVQELYE